MHKLTIIFLYITIILLASCANNNHIAGQEVMLKTHFKVEKHAKYFRLEQYGDSTIMNVLHASGMKIYKYLLQDDSFELFDSIQLSSTAQSADYFQVTPTHILIFNYTQAVLEIQNTETRDYKKWNTTYTSNGQNYYMTAYSDIELYFTDNQINGYTYTSESDYLNKFKNSGNYLFSLNGDSTISPLKRIYQFPQNVSKTNFKRSMPLRVLSSSGNTFYAFTASDTIYKIDTNNQLSEVKIDLKHWQDTDRVPWDSLNNIIYSERYFAEQSKLVRLYINETTHHLYAVVKHPQPYENHDGTLNLMRDAPWSIVIFNESLEQLKTIDFPARGYYYFNLHPTKNGILLCKSYSYNDNTKGMDFVFENIILDL